MELTGKNILGNTLSAKGSETFYAQNPSTLGTLPKAFHSATPEEIDEAVQEAERAFQVYRIKSGVEKAIFLETIAEEIILLDNALIQRCVEESGLPEARIISERGRTAGQLKLFASLLREGSWVDARIDTADPERKPLPKVDIRSMLRPLGPVAVFGASNFPLAFSVAGGDTASALASGCTVVCKGHPSHPGTSELVGIAIQKAIEKTGMPSGTFSLIQGMSIEVGTQLVRHPGIKAVGFTGSFRGGKAIFDEANKRSVPIPVYAEMGSSNPVFILPNALRERKDQIAKDLSASVNLGVGQFCTNPGLVFVEKSDDQKAFVESLKTNFSTYPSGVMLNASIQGSYTKGIERLTSNKNVTVLAQGKNEGDGCRGISHLLQSSGDSFLEDHILEEEVFGPSTIIISAKSKNQLMKIAEKLQGHLTITVHGTEEDLNEHGAFLQLLEQKAGRLVINGYPTGVEVCHSMVHGGPFPATTDGRSTSVGTAAILRFSRPVCYQNFPQSLLPNELKDDNPLEIWRKVNGDFAK
jgi:alpha-ketoglutaric semialdehyde dehydrogenase